MTNEKSAELTEPGVGSLSGKGLARFLRRARSVSSPSPQELYMKFSLTQLTQ